tara:strand:- start:405 stop:566 length:162 start_codon:yes stop_codon:yes gene_type:complete
MNDEEDVLTAPAAHLVLVCSKKWRQDILSELERLSHEPVKESDRKETGPFGHG